MAVRVLIVDDHPVVRLALRHWLEGSGDLEVAGETGTGAAAAEEAERHGPDVALIDVHMSGEAGLRTARLLRQLLPDLRVLVLGEDENRAMIEEAVRAGAWGVVPSTWQPAELAAIVRAALEARRTGVLDLTEDPQGPS